MKPKNIDSKLDSDKKGKNLKEKNIDLPLEKNLFIIRIILDILFSILVIAFSISWISYSLGWKIIFQITIWSFWSNIFYIIAITVLDICLYFGKKLESINYFIRNFFLRILFPFSLGIVILYWILVLLGENYIIIENTLLEYSKGFSVHGVVLFFVIFEIFTGEHINNNKYFKYDLIIISSIMLIHFSIVIILKKYFDFYHYEYLKMSDNRQMIASFIIIYLIILNGYIIFYLISDNFFTKDDEEMQSYFSIKNNMINENYEEKNQFSEKKYENNEKNSNNKNSEKKEDNKDSNDEIKNIQKNIKNESQNERIIAKEVKIEILCKKKKLRVIIPK